MIKCLTQTYANEPGQQSAIMPFFLTLMLGLLRVNNVVCECINAQVTKSTKVRGIKKKNPKTITLGVFWM